MDTKPDQPKQPADKLPEQKLGDTPAAPWEMPTPEEKAQAEPVKEALQQAVEKVDSPETADQVAERLEQMAGDRKTQAVEEAGKAQQAAQGGDALAESAQAVEAQAAKPAPPAEKASDVIAETVEKVAATNGRDREALAQAAQEVLNPEQQGATPSPAEERHRRYLREAVIKRMKPFDALDARIYLAINHLPHNRLLNSFFYTLTFIFKGGAAWFLLIGLLALFHRKRGLSVAQKAAVPLALAALTVEFPVKTFFRRRRPFITLIQATVIGKKPGSWSFPSGHSAAAFGGAYVLSRHFRRLRWLFFVVAGLVAFSRIYLGDHYPGDVLSGSLSGIALAKGGADLQEAMDKVQSRARRF